MNTRDLLAALIIISVIVLLAHIVDLDPTYQVIGGVIGVCAITVRIVAKRFTA